MAKTTPDKKNGRPREQFDLDKIELFGRFRATYDTISSYFGVSERTIERLMSPENDPETEFCRSYKKGMADLKLKLSEAQIHNALVENNPTLQVWLGKQYLNQKDKQEINQKIEATVTTNPQEMTLEDLKAMKAIHAKYKKGDESQEN